MGRIAEELFVSCVQNNMYITVDDVRKAVRQLKLKKACGIDGIFNEHLINGGNVFYKQLALLNTNMYNHGYILDCLKKGVIVTILKGGQKSKSDLNNYRAITSASGVLKLLERILLPRVENAMNASLNSLQGRFRADLGCRMSSLMLKECIAFAKENYSKLFVCFHDVQKAYDSHFLFVMCSLFPKASF